MTNHWTDLANVDYFLVIGSNPAENHPISFHWVTQALENRGAKLLVVDPRFSRTAAKAHMYAPLRSGTDIAFVNGMINRILENNLYNADYIKYYTNASFKVNAAFRAYLNANTPFPGTFPGLNTSANPPTYDKTTWGYQVDPNTGIPLKDDTLQDSNCIFQIMKQFFSRYTPEVVEKITGCPQATLIQVTDEYAKTAAPDKAGTIMYAMGATQHTYGTQNIRAYG
ncbi:MAG: molybdopterin-dependent oxidoreductase, partial [Proteobacteria bacterium]|nr:molybdopterin-dependent oxidoreductase [Pseudomonadota bacterium]